MNTYYDIRLLYGGDWHRSMCSQSHFKLRMGVYFTHIYTFLFLKLEHKSVENMHICVGHRIIHLFRAEYVTFVSRFDIFCLGLLKFSHTDAGSAIGKWKVKGDEIK